MDPHSQPLVSQQGRKHYGSSAVGVSVQDLFGGQFIAPEQVRRRLASLEQQFAADFKEQAEGRALIGHLDLLSKAKISTREAVAGLRSLHAQVRERELRHLRCSRCPSISLRARSVQPLPLPTIINGWGMQS